MNALAGAAQQFGPGLLVAALAAPLVILAASLSLRLRAFAWAMTPLAPLPAIPAAALAIWGAPFGAELPALRVNLWLDRPGGMLLAAAALVWLIRSVFALTDEAGRPNADRFAVSWLLTMAGSLGVFIAADLLTFYLVYAMVSVPAYYLIVSDEDAGSSRAAGVYLAFTLIGEAVLLIAFVMLAAGEPGGSLDIRAVVAALPTSPWRDAALVLLIIGFGMKIGLVPMHSWMPLAYTAAPIPAAAVLSGAAVKAGIIGLIRFLPLGAALPSFGEALAWAGFVSAFYGAAIGLTQQNPKTVLAYSSVSQMGVIAAALGMGLASANQGAAADAAFYAVNHVFVKAGLFLTVGVVAARSGRRPNVGADRRRAACAQPRRIAPDRRGARQACGQGTVRRRPGQMGGRSLGGREHGAHAAFRHAACAIAERRGQSVARARLVVALARGAFCAGSLAHVSRSRRRCRRCARGGTAVGRDLADACRRRSLRRVMGAGGPAAARPRRRYCRRRGGGVPRLGASRGPDRAPGRAAQAMAGGRHGAAGDRPHSRGGRVRRSLTRPPAPPQQKQSRRNKIKARRNKNKAEPQQNQRPAQQNQNRSSPGISALDRAVSIAYG